MIFKTYKRPQEEFREELQKNVISEYDLSGCSSNDEVKENLLKRAGVDPKLIANPVSRKKLFKQLDYIHPFNFDRKITVDEGWIKLYGEKYKDRTLTSLCIDIIRDGKDIEPILPVKVTKWKIEDGTVILTHESTIRQTDGKMLYTIKTDTYSVDDENVCITTEWNHKEYFKNELELSEDYKSKDKYTYNMNGIQINWERDTKQIISLEKLQEFREQQKRREQSGKKKIVEEPYDSQTSYENFETRERHITVSRDKEKLSIAIVKASHSDRELVIDLTNSKKDISTLEAVREIVNTNYIDPMLRYNAEKKAEVEERLAKKISESELPEGCERYGKSQSEKTL